MLFRDPRVLAFVLIAIGGGLLIGYGQQWYELPRWDEARIEETVDVKLEGMGAGLILTLLGLGAALKNRLWPSQDVDRSRP